ncbi:MAG: hypothetical protein NTY35_08340 [Planctomycetota bacterium]|nr:hypothetical protein [Planctomycetota bacterium]
MPLRRALILLPLALVSAWFAWRWADLPERFATSFDFAGQPRDSMGRGAYAGLALGMLAGLAVLFGGLATWIPAVPAAWVNLPEKDYWLAPERRQATLERLSTFLDFAGLATGVALSTLFVAIGEHAIAGSAALSSAWLAGPALVVLLVGGGVVWLDAPFRARRRALRARTR